jgi:hypothetical protein
LGDTHLFRDRVRRGDAISFHLYLGNGGSACFYTYCDNGWVFETVAVNMPFFYTYPLGLVLPLCDSVIPRRFNSSSSSEEILNRWVEMAPENKNLCHPKPIIAKDPKRTA